MRSSGYYRLLANPKPRQRMGQKNRGSIRAGTISASEGGSFVCTGRRCYFPRDAPVFLSLCSGEAPKLVLPVAECVALLAEIGGRVLHRIREGFA